MRTRTIIGVGAVLLLAALCGDTVAQPSHPAQTTPSKASAQTLTGVVRIAEPSPKGGKRFLGVLLEVDTGPACVLTYRADDLWAAFNGRRIVVTGQRYYPEGQALLAPHFKPLNWHVERPATEDAIIDVGPEMTLRGTFAPYTWPAGTKLAGETVTRFVAAPGEAYFLAKAPTPLPLAKPVEVRARRVEPSRFIARPGGSYLWIYEIMPR